MCSEGNNQATVDTIFYIHSSDDLYGSDVVLFQLVTRLDRTKYRPVIILPDDMKHVGLLSSELETAGIEHCHLPIAILRRKYLSWGGIALLLYRMIVGTLAIRRLTRAQKPKVIHGFTAAVLAAPFAAIILRIPLVMHFQEILVRPPAMRRFLHGLATRSACKVVCVSEAVRVNILQDEGWAGERLVVIQNGIPDVQPLLSRSELRREMGLALDLPVVGMIARVSPGKGHETFIDAISLLERQGIRSQYVSIGGVFDKEYQHLDRLKERIKALALSQTLHLMGFQKNARRFLCAFDILVLPSRTPESFGLVALEAMAASLPVVATAHGGVVEIVVDGCTGLLVPPGDHVSLAQAIGSLLQDPIIARRMGEAGRARFESVFSCEKVVSQIEDLYCSI